jgi:hypothetical protein
MECQHVYTHSYIHYCLDVIGSAALLPDKAPTELTEQECESTPLTVWASWRKEESLALLGIECTTIAKPYSDGAFQPPYMA